jgi:hypothetical protein
LKNFFRFFLLFVVIMAFSGCIPQRFPVIRPVFTPSKKEVSRARAEEYFVNGRDYDRRGIPEMAVRFYEMAFAFDPSSAVLRQTLAEKYVELSRYRSCRKTRKKSFRPCI